MGNTHLSFHIAHINLVRGMLSSHRHGVLMIVPYRLESYLVFDLIVEHHLVDLWERVDRRK